MWMKALTSVTEEGEAGLSLSHTSTCRASVPKGSAAHHRASTLHQWGHFPLIKSPWDSKSLLPAAAAPTSKHSPAPLILTPSSSTNFNEKDCGDWAPLSPKSHSLVLLARIIHLYKNKQKTHDIGKQNKTKHCPKQAIFIGAGREKDKREEINLVHHSKSFISQSSPSCGDPELPRNNGLKQFTAHEKIIWWCSHYRSSTMRTHPMTFLCH